MSDHFPSYRRIEQADVAGWTFDGPLPAELLPVEICKRGTTERAWAQVADGRTQNLVASVLEDGGKQALGVVLKRRPRLVRQERGKPADGYPDALQMEAVTSVELPTAQEVAGYGAPLGEIFANPAHGIHPTGIRMDRAGQPLPGLSYIGMPELSLIMARGGVDARLIAALLLLRAKHGIALADGGAAGSAELVSRLARETPLPAHVVKHHTHQARLGIVHVTAGWTDKDGDHEQLVRIENGTAVAAPGMALPHFTREDGALQMGVVDNWRPLIGGDGRWLTEIPGGFNGWKKELKGEFGAEVDPAQAAMMPTIVADPSAEGYDIDLRSMGLQVTGEQVLDETEEGMMGGPSWLTPHRLMHFTKKGVIADGRSMAAMQMFEVLGGRDFLADYRAWLRSPGSAVLRNKDAE